MSTKECSVLFRDCNCLPNYGFGCGKAAAMLPLVFVYTSFNPAIKVWLTTFCKFPMRMAGSRRDSDWNGFVLEPGSS